MPRALTYTRPRLELAAALEEYPLSEDGFIAENVLPAFGVQRKEASLPVITRESILREVDVRRSKGGAYSREGFETDELSYRCEEKGLEGKLDDEDVEFYSNDFSAEMVTTALTRDRLAREREKRVAALFFNTTTWTGAALYTDLGTDWDSAASTPIADVDTAKEKVRKGCGRRPNTMIISAAVIPWLKANTDIGNRLRYVMALTGNNIERSLSELFGIERVEIAGAIKNTGAEGEAFASSDIWDDNYCWIGVCPRTNNIAEACVGRTMLWTPDSPTMYTVDQYEEPQTRSRIYRVRHHIHEKVWDAAFGHLLKIDT